MDFLSFLQDQSTKLNSWNYVKILWNELAERSRESGEVGPDVVQDFNHHLPVLLEEFWESAVEKVSQADALIEPVDEKLKEYIMVLVYHCSTQCQETVSLKCVSNACEVYLGLLLSNQSEYFFNSKLYTTILSTLQTSLESCNDDTVSIVVKLKKYLAKSKLKTCDLEITLATLVHVLFTKSNKIFESFETDDDDGTIPYQTLLCLKVLFINESLPRRKFLITTFLLNGLRKYNTVHMTPQCFNIIQVNFRRLLRDKSMHAKFKDDDYHTFLNAFIHVWKNPEFAYFNEAVLMMNALREKHYRLLIDVLNKMLMSKKPTRNMFKFSLAIICNPPKHTDIDKVKITNEILLRNILTNCISSNTEICNSSIEALAEILVSPDLQKHFVLSPVKNVLSCLPGNGVLDTPTILKGLRTFMNKKWTNKSRNKHLFAISISIILFTETEYSGLYKDVLEVLTEEASPFDLKPFLHLITETYLNCCVRKFDETAFQILKILFRSAVHPMASSTEFVKYLYSTMVFPSMCKGIAIKSEYFIDPILSSDFNYTEFFQKCHTLGLIRDEHVAKLMGNLYSMNDSKMRLACAIIHLTNYKEVSVISEHINDNFMTVCNDSNLTYLFYIYNKILNTNQPSTCHETLRSKEIMACFLKHHLMGQSFRWNCVANAFALLKSLEAVTNLDEAFRKLKEEYDRKLISTLQNQGSILPLIYYSQLVIFSKLIPQDEAINGVVSFLTRCKNEIYIRSPDFNPKLWIGCLLLYTNICVIKQNLVENGICLIRDGLHAPVTAVKLACLNMMFDLCNMVTHNFEHLIRFMFTQLVYGDNIFKKTCLVKIDRLIRDDYLKLDQDQFLIFVSILGDKYEGLGDYLQQLLTEHFFISNTGVIAKFFVPLIIHINEYKKHPEYKLSTNTYTLLENMKCSKLDRRKIFTLLLTNLPVKARFNIIYIISTSILESMMKRQMKPDHGFWSVIKDSIFIFKLFSAGSNDEDSTDSYYKKISAQISKYIVGHSDLADKRIYPEHQKEIVKGTEVLLKLLFFNDCQSIQRHIKICVFDAAMHWTGFLLPDLIHIVHVDRLRTLQDLYCKVDNFYKKNMSSLRYEEETFEREGGGSSSVNTTSCSLFTNSEQQIIPDFD